MMNFLTTGLAATLLFSTAALAQSPDMDGKSYQERKEAVKNMSEAERKAFFDERKAKWDAMSDAEKLQQIEEKRAKMQQEREARWNAMTDAEKIGKAEKMLQRMRDGKGPHNGPHGHKGGNR